MAVALLFVLAGGWCGAASLSPLSPREYVWAGALGRFSSGEVISGAWAAYDVGSNIWRVSIGGGTALVLTDRGANWYGYSGGLFRDGVGNLYAVEGDVSDGALQVSVGVWNVLGWIPVLSLTEVGADRVYAWDLGDYSALWRCLVGGAVAGGLLFVMFGLLLPEALRPLVGLVS